MHCELTAKILTRGLSDYFSGRVKTSWTKYLKILYFCLDKIIFVQGDRASLPDIMCNDSTCVVAMVTQPHPSIPLKMTFRWGKISLGILGRKR